MLGLVLCAIGVVSLGGSMYLKKQIAEGNLKISNAEHSVKQGQSLFSTNPISKEVGKGLFGSANKQISAGRDEIAYYTKVAQALQVGGIVFIIAGLGCIFVGRRDKR